MKDINSCTFSGRLTRDAELRATASGKDVISFSVAVNDSRRTADGWEDKPNFLDMKYFGNDLEKLCGRLQKGTKVCVESRADWSKFDTKDGKTRTKVEFIVSQLVIAEPAAKPSEPAPLYADADLPF